MFEKGKMLGATVLLIAALLLTGIALGTTGTTNNLDSDVALSQTGGSLVGSQYTGSFSSPSGIVAAIQTGVSSTDPAIFKEYVQNGITQAGSHQEDAQITNRGSVTNGGWIPTIEASMDFNNLVTQTSSGTGVKASSLEENGEAAAGNIKKVELNADNEHLGAVYGTGSSQTTTEFNRADVNIFSGWCFFDTSTATVNLNNRVYDDPGTEKVKETNILSGDPWSGVGLYGAKAGSIDTNLGNNLVAGAADKNNGTLINIGYSSATWSNKLDESNTALMFGTGPSTTLGLTEGNEGHTAGVFNLQNLDNKGTILRPTAGTGTIQTSNDYTSTGYTNIVNPGTVTSIS
jgi:hypothetical protein